MLENILFTIDESSLEQNPEDLKIKEIEQKLEEIAHLDVDIKRQLKKFLTQCQKNDFNLSKQQLKDYLCQNLDIITPQAAIESPLHSRSNSNASTFSVGSFDNDVGNFAECLYYLCFHLNDQKIGYREIMSEIENILNEHLSSADNILLSYDSKECSITATKQTINQQLPTISKTSFSITVESPIKTLESNDFKHLINNSNITPRSPARKKRLENKSTPLKPKQETASRLFLPR